MAFEGLAEKLQAAFQKLNNRGKLTEKDVKDRDARGPHGAAGSGRQLHRRQGFCQAASPSARWAQEILSSLTPGQQVIKIVNEELTAADGRHAAPS